MTTAQEQKAIDGFRGIQNVVANSEKFKIKLGIGRDAYTSLKVSKAVAQLWDLGGAAGTRGIAFGFVGSHRDRKSSSPDYERNERAKKFFLCSPF